MIKNKLHINCENFKTVNHEILEVQNRTLH